MKCRICHSENLTKFLDLGYHPPSDAFLDNLNEPETHYPLTVYVCENCELFQLGYVVPKEILYNDKYPYETGMNVEGVAHFGLFAQKVVRDFNLGSGDLVVDIGSNDGTLLSGFKDFGCVVLGVEPVRVLAEKTESRGIPVANGFFGKFARHFSRFKDLNISEARVITATNVFAHVDNLHDFMMGINSLLAPDGVFIIEAPSAGDLLERFEYDTIYHEHLSFLHLKPLSILFEQYGMFIDTVEWYPVHGGTNRYYVKREKVGAKPVLFLPLPSFSGFAEKVEKNRDELVRLLRSIKRKHGGLKGKRIVGVSAPAKGNTLLNYCKIGTETLDYITEKSDLKIGKYTPGSHIPIVPDSRLLEDMPDYALILAWNWAEQIMNNLKEYTDRGGKWIIPIPEPHIARVGAGAWVPIEGL